MRVKNPFYVGPVETFVDANKVAISAYMQSKSGLPNVTFDMIRADNPGVADPVTGGPLSDGSLAAIFLALGFKVIE